MGVYAYIQYNRKSSKLFVCYHSSYLVLSDSVRMTLESHSGVLISDFNIIDLKYVGWCSITGSLSVMTRTIKRVG